MKVLYIAAECKPFSKVGGVGDVTGELPPAIQRQGVDIEIVTPLFDSIKPELYSKKPTNKYKVAYQGNKETVQVHEGEIKGVQVNLLKNKSYFGGEYGTPYIFSPNVPFLDDVLRFGFFSEACLHLIDEKKPDIVHANDWPLGFLFGRMEMKKMPQKRVLSVHNIGYQGNIGKDTVRGWDIERLLKDKTTGPLFTDPRAAWNSVNPLRLGLELADMVNTVSPGYCTEIIQPEDQKRYFEGGKGLEGVTNRLYEDGRLTGILNGFEYTFKPTEAQFKRAIEEKAAMKQLIAGGFPDPQAFLLGFVGRLAEQKFRLLAEMIDGRTVLEHILAIPGINVAILGTGASEYESLLRDLSGHDNLAVTIAFDAAKARQISLGSDVFLMPSLYEPCGITQLESLSHATPPLVRWTGGLLDTVKPYTDADGTGFGFDGASRSEVLTNLIKAVVEARDYYQKNKAGFEQLQWRGFKARFDWEKAARQYIQQLYEPLVGEKITQHPG